MAEADDHFGDARAIGTVADIGDEGAVDLQPVDRQAVEIRKGREAGAEIVDGDRDASTLRGVQLRLDVGAVGHRHRFSDFQLDQRWRQPAIGDRGGHVGDEILGQKLYLPDVDRHPHVGPAGGVNPCQRSQRRAQHPRPMPLISPDCSAIRMKRSGGHEFAGIGSPAHQRLEAERPAGPEIDLRPGTRRRGARSTKGGMQTVQEWVRFRVSCPISVSEPIAVAGAVVRASLTARLALDRVVAVSASARCAKPMLTDNWWLTSLSIWRARQKRAASPGEPARKA